MFTTKYRLPKKPREPFYVITKNIHYLLCLFIENCHEYMHERANVQIRSALSLFVGSSARADAMVESDER